MGRVCAPFFTNKLKASTPCFWCTGLGFKLCHIKKLHKWCSSGVVEYVVLIFIELLALKQCNNRAITQNYLTFYPYYSFSISIQLVL